jgi:hypothetical protein
MTTIAPEITGVHPLADLFPMVTEDLPALAADIKANGLRHPLAVTPDGVLIDGRRRRAACEIAGVEPDFVIVDEDAADLILSENVFRRHMTKGQIAILAVVAELGIALPEIDVLSESAVDPVIREPKKYDYQRQAHRRVERLVSASVVKAAATIVQWAPDLARLVLETGGGWKMAQATAIERSKAANSEEQRRAIMANDAPELLAQVADDGLTLTEAWGLRDKRIREERENRLRLTGHLVDRITPLLDKSNPTDLVEHYDPELARKPIGIAELDEAINYLRALRSEFKRQRKG